MKLKLVLALLLALSPFAARAEASTLRRFALLVGVNDGGPERIRLRYAATDAQAFGKVLVELGGVAESDRLWVLESDRAGLLQAFEKLRRLTASAQQQPGARVEVVLYYSGHSDETGLLLRGQRLTYKELRAELDQVPAHVRLAVVDSCASGALSRSKGGQLRPAFLVDASAQVRGNAILTSSSANEVSQESDRLRGSFFTHHLVSGMRGAADITRDGRVTLTEAYQFAFQETLAQTESTRGGAQHPSYDIELAGTGDLVMTDLRSGAAGLALAEGLDGRLFVRDATGALVVEVNKRAGAAVDLALPPGKYSVRRETQDSSALANVELEAGKRLALGKESFTATPLEATALRGDAPPLRKAPVNLSLVPSLSTNDAAPEPVENMIALGIVTRSAALSGMALGVVGTWVDQDMRGFQGSFGYNMAGGNVRGGQLTLGANLVGGTMAGGQLSTVYNGVQSDFTGVQLTSGVNVAHGEVRGWQLSSVANYAGTLSTGMQTTGGLNIARGGWRGLQVGGAGNYAGELIGMQVGVVNIGGDVTGAQVGVVNIAGKARGAQLGVVNISDDIEGAPIGLVNIVRQGQFHPELYATDLEPVNLALKFGSRRTYTTIFAGTGRQRTLHYGLGLGLHLGPEPWWVDVDLTGSSVIPYEALFSSNNVLGQLRVVGGVQLGSRFAIYAGPTANVMVSFNREDPLRFSYLPVLREWRSSRVAVGLWPGAVVGIRL
ncbi:MAG TPA: caspase family protein [Myxococcaceae bacterium]|nr:caspase family protein [Myxococcaceae bacterium]